MRQNDRGVLCTDAWLLLGMGRGTALYNLLKIGIFGAFNWFVKYGDK